MLLLPHHFLNVPSSPPPQTKLSPSPLHCVFVCVFDTDIVMGRPPCCDKANVKKGPWTAEEDAKILAYVASHGIGNWTLVPQKAGLNRCGKSCRLRWTNYLRPDLKHDNFTPQEEDLILEFHRAVGSRWSLIAKNLPGRTDNDVKNHWNTKLKKKLTKMGIDPITHKPFRQLLSDYGNISDLPNARNRVPPFLNHNNNNFTPNTNIPNTQGFSVSTHETIRGNNASNQAWENLAHFQATNGQEMASYSSTSSPCSPTLTHMNLPSSPSAWSEYLASDASLFPNKDQGQYCDFQWILEEPAECEGVKRENGNEACRVYSSHDMFIGSMTNNFFDNASSSSSSFVEAMLNRDREMQLEFPQLLDGLNID